MESPLFVGNGREAQYGQENFDVISRSGCSSGMNGKRKGRMTVEREEVSQLGTGGSAFAPKKRVPQRKKFLG
jgi:hypothetical protein